MVTIPTSEPPEAPKPSAPPKTQPILPDPPIVETATEARQAVIVPPMKYVLGFGIAGAAIGLLLAWLFLH